MRADEYHQWELEQQERLEKDHAFYERMIGIKPSKTVNEATQRLIETLKRKRKWHLPHL